MHETTWEAAELTAFACTCPRDRHKCPHCFEEIEQIALLLYHIDQCHKRAFGATFQTAGRVCPSVRKSIPPNASH